jgi:hypothetical protein
MLSCAYHHGMVHFAMNIMASVPPVKILHRKQLFLAIYLRTVGRNQKSLFPAAGYCAFVETSSRLYLKVRKQS